MKETGVARGWNLRDGVGDPKIWREWPAWSLAAMDQRECSQDIAGMCKDSEVAPALLFVHGVEDHCLLMDKGLGSAARESCSSLFSGQLRQLASDFHPIVC